MYPRVDVIVAGQKVAKPERPVEDKQESVDEPKPKADVKPPRKK